MVNNSGFCKHENLVSSHSDLRTSHTTPLMSVTEAWTLGDRHYPSHCKGKTGQKVALAIPQSDNGLCGALMSNISGNPNIIVLLAKKLVSLGPEHILEGNAVS